MKYLTTYTFFLIAWLGAAPLLALSADEDIAATTANGEKVILHANGYWEYVDEKKAAVTKAKLQELAKEEGCPRGTRPSFFGYGRCISVGDEVLKRGSLSGKGR
jgi:hypothetical protein